MVSRDNLALTGAQKAARWAKTRRGHNLRHALTATHSSDPRAKALSVRDVANIFDVPYSTLAREMKALSEGKPDSKSAVRVGRPSLLTDSEDKALTLFICMMYGAEAPAPARDRGDEVFDDDDIDIDDALEMIDNLGDEDDDEVPSSPLEALRKRIDL